MRLLYESRNRRAVIGARRIAEPVKPALLWVLRHLNSALRKVTEEGHHIQHLVEWGVRPIPEWYDHQLDVFWAWQSSGNSLFVERGVYSGLAIELGANVLDICCGDGFCAKYFYSHRAGQVTAMDFDADAIANAERVNSGPNIKYILGDVRIDLPTGLFDNVTWDAAIEHFTADEIQHMLLSIRDRLKPRGVLSGYTLLERADGQKSLEHHEYEFKSKHDLLNVLTPVFSNVVVFETIFPERTNLYWWASQSAVCMPFSSKNPRFCWSDGEKPT